MDRLAVRGHDVPGAAELRDPLAQDLARPSIADVVVERVPGIRELQAAVASPDGPEQACMRSSARGKRSVGDDVRRPREGTCFVAGARCGPVVREPIQREAASIH